MHKTLLNKQKIKRIVYWKQTSKSHIIIKWWFKGTAAPQSRPFLASYSQKCIWSKPDISMKLFTCIINCLLWRQRLFHYTITVYTDNADCNYTFSIKKKQYYFRSILSLIRLIISVVSDNFLIGRSNTKYFSGIIAADSRPEPLKIYGFKQ